MSDGPPWYTRRQLVRFVLVVKVPNDHHIHVVCQAATIANEPITFTSPTTICGLTGWEVFEHPPGRRLQVRCGPCELLLQQEIERWEMRVRTVLEQHDATRATNGHGRLA